MFRRALVGMMMAWLPLALGFAPPAPAAQGAPKTMAGADGAPMVLVPAGEFIMGSNDGRYDEMPRRSVYLDGFYIDKFEVTNDRYMKFVRATNSNMPEWMERWSQYNIETGRKKNYYKRLGSALRELSHPVVGVSWNNAVAYCRWAGKRLPTEAEWEKAARGTDGQKYPWGNDWDALKVIWRKSSDWKTHPVDRSYKTHKSPYGAVDMIGNVWEWVNDWYGGKYYRTAPEKNPKGPGSGSWRVFRGGSWYDKNTTRLRAAIRDRLKPEFRFISSGFRCAKALK